MKQFIKKALIFALELLVIFGCFWLTNRFVEQVMAPDYTLKFESPEPLPPDATDLDLMHSHMRAKRHESLRIGIESKRKGGRMYFFMLTAFAAVGYYCLKTAANERHRRDRGEKEPKAANRQIVFYRFMGMMAILSCVFLWPMGMLMHGIENIIPETGRIGPTYPFGQFDPDRLIVLFICPLFISVCMGPWFMLRGIVRISPWLCLGMTVSFFGTTHALYMFELSPWWNLLILGVCAFLPNVRKEGVRIWHEVDRL